METKDYLTLTLSVLAFGLGVFNLWWGSFRRRVALFFVQGAGWSFGLVNGGKTDILVTNVQYWFSGANSNTSTGPVQTSTVPLPHLLKAGTAIYPTISFERQAESFALMAKDGRAIPDDANLKSLTGTLHISWIDNDGEEHFPEAKVCEVTVNDQTGHVRDWRPLARRANLSPSRLPKASIRKPLAAIWNR